MDNSVVAGKSRQVATSFGLALTGLALFAACVGDKIVEPHRASSTEILASRWISPSGDSLVLSKLGLGRPSIDSVNHCHTAVYFGKRGAVNPYRYDKVILPTHGNSAVSSVDSGGVIRMRVFRLNVRVRRITRMADCVIPNTPEAVAQVKAKFWKRNRTAVASQSTTADDVGGFVGQYEPEEITDEFVGDDAPEGDSASAVSDTWADAVRDVTPSVYSRVGRSVMSFGSPNSPLFKPATATRGVGIWDCDFVGSSQIICDTGNGDTWCSWTPGGIGYDVYACDNGCYVILGTFDGGFWCGEFEYGDPDDCEQGQIMDPYGNCICEGSGGVDPNRSPTTRAEITGRGSTPDGGGEIPDLDESPEEASATADATLFDARTLIPSAPERPIEAVSALGDEMPDCGEEGGGGEDPPPPPPPEIAFACTPTTVERVQPIRCELTVVGGGLTQIEWRFVANPAVADLTPVAPAAIAGPVASSTWAGPMVTSGTVSVSALQNGNQINHAADIVVTQRPAIQMGSIDYKIVVSQLNVDPPHRGSDLGRTGAETYLAGADIQMTVDAGPNEGYRHTSQMEWLEYRFVVEINYNQAKQGSTLHGWHVSGVAPVGYGTPPNPCPALTIGSIAEGGLKRTIEKHEGTAWDTGSHVFNQRKFFLDQKTAIQMQFEAIVTENITYSAGQFVQMLTGSTPDQLVAADNTHATTYLLLKDGAGNECVLIAVNLGT